MDYRKRCSSGTHMKALAHKFGFDDYGRNSCALALRPSAPLFAPGTVRQIYRSGFQRDVVRFLGAPASVVFTVLTVSTHFLLDWPGLRRTGPYFRGGSLLPFVCEGESLVRVPPRARLTPCLQGVFVFKC